MNNVSRDFNIPSIIFEGDAVPPWIGYHEEEVMKSQILALSSVSSDICKYRVNIN